MFFQCGQRCPMPMLGPFHDARLIDFEFMRKIFAHARHDQGM